MAILSIKRNGQQTRTFWYRQKSFRLMPLETRYLVGIVRYRHRLLFIADHWPTSFNGGQERSFFAGTKR